MNPCEKPEPDEWIPPVPEDKRFWKAPTPQQQPDWNDEPALKCGTRTVFHNGKIFFIIQETKGITKGQAQ